MGASGETADVEGGETEGGGGRRANEDEWKGRKARKK